MPNVFQDYAEDTTFSGPEERLYLKVWRRSYNLPSDAESLIPVRGSAVTPRGLTAGSGIGAHRILFAAKTRTKDQFKITVLFYQIVAYSGTPTGNGSELRGSRQGALSYSGNRRTATRLFATTDGITGLPAEGEQYPGDSGLTGRRCVDVSDDFESLPGLHLHRVIYRSFRSG